MSTQQADRRQGISKWYLTRVGWLDVVRYPGALITSALVVAGICLPLLLLIGLKRGLVEQFVTDISKSPTAREVSLWVVQEKAVLTPAGITDLVRQHPGIEMVIPNIRKVVGVRRGPGNAPSIDALTLMATDESDPYLAAHGVVTPGAGERSLVLSKRAAELLGVNVGDTLQLEASRSEGTSTGRAQLDVQVKDILETGSRDTTIGYAHWKLLEQIEEYQSGETIPEFGWPGYQMPVKPRYTCFLCFSRRPLTENDGVHLRARGLCAEILPSSEPEDPRRNLYGLLGGNTPEYVYVVRANTAAAGEVVPLNFTAAEIEAMLETNVVPVPWNEPVILDLGGSPRQLVGLTLRPRWLRDRFVVRQSWFETDELEYAAVVPVNRDVNEPSATMTVRLSPDTTVPLVVRCVPFIKDVNDADKRASRPDAPAAGDGMRAMIGPAPEPGIPDVTVTDVNLIGWPILMAPSAVAAVEPGKKKIVPAGQSPAPLAVVPAVLLAHIHQSQNGKARFDKNTKMFVRPKSSVGYYQARVFARTLDDVLVLHRELAKQFAVESSLTRILEMKDYGRTLKMLVNVVGCVVFVFGLVTVTSLLSDITARKAGDIGILSCMGISKWAAVYFVIIRATLIGGLGSFIAYVSSIGMSLALDHWFGVQCAAPVYDVWWLLPFSIVCCWAGAVVPALRAATLDPVRCLQGAKVW